MTARVIWQHPKKENKRQNMLSWLKFAVSLPVALGFTWIPGLFVINLKEAIPLVYIVDFLVASLGTFIFVIFVVIFKPARAAYSTWWKFNIRKSDILSKYFGDSFSLHMVRN